MTSYKLVNIYPKSVFQKRWLHSITEVSIKCNLSTSDLSTAKDPEYLLLSKIELAISTP